MKFYYFGGHIDANDSIQMNNLEDHHFDGTLFTYNPNQGDFFTLMARNMEKQNKIKYMIAIRPHALSAQYLSMINASINSIQPNRLQINLIAGHIKPDELDFNGILNNVNDHSSVPERVNYLIKYIEELENMKSNPNVSIPDCYVSCTNIYAFEAAAKLNYKIILPYRDYKNGYFLDTSEFGKTKPGADLDISNKKIMLAVGAIIRDAQEEIEKEFPKNIIRYSYDGTEYSDRERFATDTEYFTYEEFVNFINKLESENINEVLLHGYPDTERETLIKYVKQYVESTL